MVPSPPQKRRVEEEEEEELEEADLFGAGADQDASDIEDQDIEEDDRFDASVPLPSMETGSGSAHSATTLGVIAEEESGGRRGMAPTQPRGIACSMPAEMGMMVKMGSSVPIAIARRVAAEQQTADPHPATFVPPHQLSQREDFMFSFTGESPAGAVKRDRLKARNAILKSTGFLERGMYGEGTSPGAGTAGLAVHGERGSLLNKGLLGGLSQALHAVGSPGAVVR